MKKLKFRPAKFSRRKAELGFYGKNSLIKEVDLDKFLEAVEEIGSLGQQKKNYYHRNFSK